MTETVEVKTVVLKVLMHCEGCASSVKRAVARTPGVISYTIEFPAQKVTVIGNVKPDEVLRRVAKTGKHATFWPQEEEPPVPKEEKEQKKEKQENESDAKAADDDTNKEGTNEEKPKEVEEKKEEDSAEKPKSEGGAKKKEEAAAAKEVTKEGADDVAKKTEEVNNNEEEKNPEKNNEEKVEDEKKDQHHQQEEEKKPEAPKQEDPHPITVMLRVAMHCEACVDTVRRAVVRMPGVISSTVDFMAQKVTVVGNMTHEEVFKRVSRTGKQTAFWPEEPKEEKEEKKEEKEEEKKEEETKEKSKEEPEKEEPKDEKKEDTAAAAAAKEENKDKATTQVEERKEPFLVFEELYPVSFALRPDYTRYYYY